MQVKELIALLSKANPEAEVVIEDYSQSAFAGVEEALTKTVYPWNGESYTDPEAAFVLRQTHETVAMDEEQTPD